MDDCNPCCWVPKLLDVVVIGCRIMLVLLDDAVEYVGCWYFY